MSLQGQVALITGASRGVGRSCALALAGAGAAVAVGYHERAASAAEVVAAITAAGGRSIALQGDVGDAAACEWLVAETVRHFNRLDILVNNAGIALERLLVDTDVAAWDRLMAVHLRGMYACSRAALPYMMNRRYGRIINISSVWGLSGAAGEVAYSAAKAGQIGFTRALAQEVGPWGITVNAVAPGAIATEMNAGLIGSDLDEWLACTPAGRLGTPDEIAAVVRFLSEPYAAYITGQVWSPNGGQLV